MKQKKRRAQKKRTLSAFDSGKIYFSVKTERKFYFALTMLMLLSAILLKTGLF